MRSRSASSRRLNPLARRRRLLDESRQAVIPEIRSREAAVGQRDDQLIGRGGWALEVDCRDQWPLELFHQAEGRLVTGIMQLAEQVLLKGLERDLVRVRL